MFQEKATYTDAEGESLVFKSYDSVSWTVCFGECKPTIVVRDLVLVIEIVHGQNRCLE